MLLGPAGVGKSTLARAVRRGGRATRGERAVVYAFDESPDTWIEPRRAAGHRPRRQLARDASRIRQVDPAELSPGEFAYDVRARGRSGGARVVVIDSLNGYLHAMPEERFLVLQLHELLSYLGQQGVLTILMMAQAGLVGETWSRRSTSPTWPTR